MQHHSSCGLCNSPQSTSQSHLDSPSRRNQGFRSGIGLSGPSDGAVQQYLQGHSHTEPAAGLLLPNLQDTWAYISVRMQGFTGGIVLKLQACRQASSRPAMSAAMAPLSGAAGTAIDLAVRLIRVDALLVDGLKSDRKGVLCPGTDLQHFSIRLHRLQVAMHAICACQRQHLGVLDGNVAAVFGVLSVTSGRYCADQTHATNVDSWGDHPKRQMCVVRVSQRISQGGRCHVRASGSKPLCWVEAGWQTAGFHFSVQLAASISRAKAAYQYSSNETSVVSHARGASKHHLGWLHVQELKFHALYCLMS